ncbi:MAG: hypothetical protein SGILL_010575, partial [Bacillariaceae sp.]
HHPELREKLKTLRGDDSGGGDDGDNAETTDDKPSKPPRPDAPWTHEERLTKFYEEYVPEKVSDVPSLLEKYAGKEEKLFLALAKKYGPVPEDPFYADSSSDEEDESDDEELAEGMDNLQVGGGKKRRGIKAKKTVKMETRVVIQTQKVKRKKAMTIISGMDTVEGVKLKDASKAFSKKFAGSSSVKKNPQGLEEIIIQGDHKEDVAAMIVNDFKVPGPSVFLDFDGDVVPYS